MTRRVDRIAGFLSLLLAPFVAACSSSSSSAPFSSDAGDAGSRFDVEGPDTTVVDSGTDAGRDTGSPPPPVDSGVDSGVACDRPEGGLPCDPNSIFCNGAPCDTTSSYCCVMGNMPMSPQACVSANSSCSGNSLHCDEASDCPMGQICCFVATSTSSGDTKCASQCSGGFFGVHFQICRTASECGANGPCVIQTCSGVQVEACGMVTGCM